MSAGIDFHRSQAGLTVTASRDPTGAGRARVCLVGDVDTAATGLLGEAVDWLADDRTPGVLIDLEAVTYAGSALLNFLARLSRTMPVDTEFIVWRPSARARLVLRSSTMRRAALR